MSLLSNGYLLALTLAGAIEFNAEFLVIAGGGDHGDDFSAGRTDTAGGGGGGAGGYISSVSGESSGGGTSALTAPTLTTGVTYSVTVGAAASNTIFSGTDVGGTSFNHTALAGGTRNTTGGSGGGASYVEPAQGTSTAGSGTAGQGYDGSEDYFPTGSNNSVCDTPRFMCYSSSDTATFCGTGYPGAGGGAGGAASGRNGGVGVQSSITGTATYYAGGGASETVCLTNNYQQGTPGSGSTNYGGGGSYAETGQPGVVILRYTSDVTISNPGGGLTMSTSTVGANKVTTITAGTGNIEFA